MAVFSSGQFYGVSAFEKRLNGLSLTHFAATVPEHEVEEHSHDGAHFVLATRGRYITSAFGEERGGPVLVFNPPGVVHRDRFAGNGGWFFAVSLDDTPEHLPGDALRLSAPGMIRAALRLFGTAADKNASRLDLEALTLELTGQVQPVADTAHCPPWLRKVRDYIADMSGSDIGVAEVAAAAGVHPVYLARQYRRWFGCSPGDDLRRRRVERAAGLIATSTEPLSDIALLAGFCDQSHLNRAFVAQWGVTPAAYARLTGCKRPRQA